MVRTQIQLTETQSKELRRRAAERGVSMATLIREAVDQVLTVDERAERWNRALSVVGKFKSSHRDVSVNHDKYLADDFA